MYVRHNNVFFALLFTSFGHNSHHQANNAQQFKKGWLNGVHKMLISMESYLQL